ARCGATAMLLPSAETVVVTGTFMLLCAGIRSSTFEKAGTSRSLNLSVMVPGEASRLAFAAGVELTSFAWAHAGPAARSAVLAKPAMARRERFMILPPEAGCRLD